VSIGRSRALLPSLALVGFALFAVYGAALGVLLPAHVAEVDDENKVANLAIVTSASFAFTLFSQPIVGALSDRTRSRLGRRAPWMLLGAVMGAGFLLGIGALDSVLWITVFWVVIQFSLNGTDAASSAFFVEGFTVRRRGRAVGLVAAAGIVGGGVGTLLAGAFLAERSLIYALLGVVVVVAVAVFVLLNREPDTSGSMTNANDVRGMLRRFWINPRRNPDFAWAFASRFAFIVGRQGIYGYLFYLLTDLIGVSELEAAGLVATITVVGGGSLVIGFILGGVLSDRLGRRKPFVVGASLCLVAALILPLASPTVPVMIVFAAIQGVGYGVFSVCSTALVTEVLPDQGLGAAKDLGIYNMATNLGQTIGPVVAAAAITAFGYTGVFIAAMVGVTAAALLALPIRGVR